MLRKLIVLGVAVTALSGCVRTVMVPLKSDFDEAKARALLEPGVNTIKGSALVRQNGGGIVTCAGAQATLIPATDYASERLGAFYGNSTRAYRPAYITSKMTFQPDHPAYMQNVKHTVCNASGEFLFDRVADGDFLIVTPVIWNVSGPQGGYLLQRVSVNGGEIKEIVLSP